MEDALLPYKQEVPSSSLGPPTIFYRGLVIPTRKSKSLRKPCESRFRGSAFVRRERSLSPESPPSRDIG